MPDATQQEREAYAAFVEQYTGRDMAYHERNGTTGLDFGLAAFLAGRASLPSSGEEPSHGLLMSMAIRYDHALGCPGYYDDPMFSGSGVTHQQRLDSTLRTMRQLWEEVVGKGFYRPEREAFYAALSAKEPQ